MVDIVLLVDDRRAAAEKFPDADWCTKIKTAFHFMTISVLSGEMGGNAAGSHDVRTRLLISRVPAERESSLFMTSRIDMHCSQIDVGVS